MDKQIVKNLRKKIFTHIVTNRGGYKNFSAEEKVKFAIEAFENANMLSSALLNTNPNFNHFWFMYGEETNAFADSVGKSGFVVMSSKVAINLKKPETVYRLLLHELRHLYQQQELGFEEKGESSSYYFGDNKTHAAWAASPSEKAANKFAYLELFKILIGGGVLKSDERVSAFKAFGSVLKTGTSCFCDHLTGTVRYKLDEKFECFRNSSMPLGVDKDEEFGNRSGFISPDRLINIMAQKSEVFGVKVEYNQQIHNLIADSAGDSFQDLLDVVLAENDVNAPNILPSEQLDNKFEFSSEQVSTLTESDEDIRLFKETPSDGLYKLNVVSENIQKNLEEN